MTPSYAAGQTEKQRAKQESHREVPNDPYVESPRDAMGTSPSYRFLAPGIVTTQVNVNGSGQNIVGDAANEPSIALNPLDPNFISIGWRQFNTIASDFRQAGYGFTTDGGSSWTFPGVLEPGVFRSDPVLDYDASGNIYYNSLTLTGGSNYTCDVFKSTTGGSTWDGGVDARGGDKQWMTIDKTGGVGAGNVYAYWTSFYSSCSPGYFTRSTNSGASFQSCITVSGGPYWGTLDVGPDGELYVAGEGFVVAKSTNAQNDGQAIVWDFNRNVSLGGFLSYGEGPNPDGLLGQAWIAVDRSNGPTRGYVYLLASVDRSGQDPVDVMFSRSTDGGNSWSTAVRINNDAGNNYQWFGTMSVAPNGRIDVVWLDTRNDPGGFDSELFYSYSTDGGISWSGNDQMSESFDPHVGWPIQQKMGDYFDMISDDGGAHLAWAGTFNGEQDVYYSYITPEALTGIPCEDIFFFNAKCNATGAAQAMVKLSGDYSGQTVTFDLDGSPQVATLMSNGTNTIGKMTVPHAGMGDHTVTLTDPSGCFSPVMINCQVDAAPDPEWDALWAEYEVLEQEQKSIQQGTRILGNYPNPFNPTTTIRYTLSGESRVTLNVYNMLGQVVTTLVDAQQGSGYHEAVWDGRNNSGASVSTGMYIYRLTAGDFSETRRILLAK